MTIPKQLLEAKICNKNTCELKQRIDNAICILNELYDCDMKEEDYSLIYLAIKTLRGSDKE